MKPFDPIISNNIYIKNEKINKVGNSYGVINDDDHDSEYSDIDVDEIEINNINSTDNYVNDHVLNVNVSSARIIEGKNVNKRTYNPKQEKFQTKMKKKYIDKKLNEAKNNKLTINNLNIVHINARGALKKLDQLEALADQTGCHVLCVSETWFSEDIVEKLTNYEILTHRSSHKKNDAGGVAIYVRRDVVSYFRSIDLKKHLVSKEGQIVGVSSEKLNLKIFCTYRSPNMKSKKAISEYVNDIKYLKLDESDNWVFVGDVNMPSAYGINKKTVCDKVYRDIFEHFETLGIQQPIKEATHVKGNTLDVFLCSPLIDILHSKVMSHTDWKSDHFPIHLIMKLENGMRKSTEVLKIKIIDKENEDRKGYKLAMRDNREELMKIVNQSSSNGVDLDVDLAAVRFNQKIIETWDKYVKTKWVYPKREAYGIEVREQIKVLKEANLKYHRRTSDVRRESKKLTKLLEADRRNRAQERLDKIADDSDYLYKLFDEAREGERRVGPFINEDTGELTEEAQEIADLCQRQYIGVWNKDGKISVDPYSPPSWWEEGMEDLNYGEEIKVTPRQVRRAIFLVRRKVGFGPDNITGHMLKEAVDELVDPMHAMFNNMVLKGVWPKCYKQADTIPIGKPGRKDLVSNTRPISLTSLIGKVFERLLAWNFIRHLRSYKNGKYDIRKNQFGFYEGRSVNDNLMATLHRVYTILDQKGMTCEIVYFDVAKAFDRLHWNTFISDLKEVGVVGKHLSLWISWLTDRTQRVKVGNHYSEPANLSSGCCQGSTLGPLCYLQYFNSCIPYELGVNGKLKVENSYEERYMENQEEKKQRMINEVYYAIFADDTKLLSSSHNHEKLQEEINNFVSALDRIKLSINQSKTVVLYLGNKNPQHDYFLRGQKITKVFEARDLGLTFGWINRKISFDATIKHRMKICNQMARISRSAISKSDGSLNTHIKIWNTYLFPQLLTFSEFFFFESKAECEMIDAVYRDYFSNITFSIYDVETFPHPPSVMLKKLHRIRFWRCAHGMTGVDPLDMFTFLGSLEMKLKRCIISATRYSSKTFDKQNFANRHVKWFNGLPRRIGRSWKKFMEYINEPNYIYTELYDDNAEKIRSDILNGKRANVRKRRLMHIKESYDNAEERFHEYIDDLSQRHSEWFEEFDPDGASCSSVVDFDQNNGSSNPEPKKPKTQKVNNNVSCRSSSLPVKDIENLKSCGFYEKLRFFEDLTLPLTRDEEDEIARRQESEGPLLATAIPATKNQWERVYRPTEKAITNFIPSSLLEN